MAKKNKWDKMSLAERRVAFNRHLRVYLVMSLFFFLVNYFSSPGSWWFYWPMLGWGLGVAMQGISVYGPLADKEEHLTKDEWETGGLNAPQNQDDNLELKELDKRYRDDDLV